MDGLERETKMSTKTRARKGFTLVELLVVMAIISILAGLLLPALQRARQQAQQVSCLSNMKQTAAAVQLYAIDFDGYLPTSPHAGGQGTYAAYGGSVYHDFGFYRWASYLTTYPWWTNQLYPYSGGALSGAWKCPVVERSAAGVTEARIVDSGPISYMYNGQCAERSADAGATWRGHRFAEATNPSRTAVFSEQQDWMTRTYLKPARPDFASVDGGAFTSGTLYSFYANMQLVHDGKTTGNAGMLDGSAQKTRGFPGGSAAITSSNLSTLKKIRDDLYVLNRR